MNLYLKYSLFIILTALKLLVISSTYSNWYNTGLGFEMIFIFPLFLLLVVFIYVSIRSINKHILGKNPTIFYVTLLFSTIFLVNNFLYEIKRNNIPESCSIFLTNHVDLKIIFRKNGTAKIYNYHMLGTDYLFTPYKIYKGAVIFESPLKINQFILDDTILLVNDEILYRISYQTPNIEYRESQITKHNECFVCFVSGENIDK